MASKLETYERNYNHYLRWVVDGEEGGTVGEVGTLETDVENAKNRDDFECRLVNRMVSEIDEVVRDHVGFYFDSATKAKDVLRLVNFALKQPREMPDWAKTALAAGWKAPKGWKP